ncbi:MAG: GTP-binding protein [Flavobacteriaceae bacterium]
MSAKILKEHHNNEVFLRPRFSIELENSPNELVTLFKKNLEDGQCKYCSKIVDGHIVIDVPKDEDHYWSPQLHLEVEKLPHNEKAKLKGVFGPKTHVWTMFVFLHVALGFALSIFAVRAYVHWSIDMDASNSYVWMGVIAIIWICLYIFARLGRSTGKVQTEELRSFMLKTLNQSL